MRKSVLSRKENTKSNFKFKCPKFFKKSNFSTSKVVLMILASLLLVIGGASYVLADTHVSTAEVTPENVASSTEYSFDVEICNEAGSGYDPVTEVRIYEYDDFSGFTCDGKTGWESHWSPTLAACIYIAEGSSNWIDPGECTTFGFEATTPDTECCRSFDFETRDYDLDSETQGDWQLIHDSICVDKTKPETTKYFTPEGTFKIEGNVEWIDTVTQVVLEATDSIGPHDTGIDKTWYRNDLVGDILSGSNPDDICYNPSSMCVEGNVGVDTPYETEGQECIDRCQNGEHSGQYACDQYEVNTENWYDCVEDCAYDICSVENEWKLYRGEPIEKDEESCHVLQFFSVDGVGNIEDTNYNCFFVDKTPPEMEKQNGDPKVPMCDERDILQEWDVYNVNENDNDVYNVSDYPGIYDGPLNVEATTHTDGTIEFVAEVPVAFVDGSQDNVAFPFDVDNNGFADFQLSYHANQDSHYSGEYWGYREVDAEAAWSDWQEVPGGFTVSETGNKEFSILFSSDMLGGCGSDYKFGVAGSYAGTGTNGQINTGANIHFQFPEDFSWGPNWIESDDYYLTYVGAHKDWWLTQDTDVTFACQDQDPHPSEGEEICFSVKVDGSDETDRYCNSSNYDGIYSDNVCCIDTSESKFVLNFLEDSKHELKYFCKDAVNKRTETHTQIYRVDSEEPDITKIMLGDEGIDWIGMCPPTSQNDECYVAGGSGINVAAVDPDPTGEGCAVNDIECIYHLFWYTDKATCEDAGHNWQPSSGKCIVDTRAYGDAESTPPFDVVFTEDSEHEFYLSCIDALENEVVDVENFLVDMESPNTTKTYEGPVYQGECAEYIDTASRVNLTAEDEKVGVDYTKYRVTLVGDSNCEDTFKCAEAQGQGDWITYENPFPIDEESCHLIEYRSVDKFGNQENIKKQCVYVDKTPPTVTKEVGEPKISCEGGDISVGDSNVPPREQGDLPGDSHLLGNSEGPCDSITQGEGQCAYVDSTSLPSFVYDTVISEGGDSEALSTGCGNILILSSGDPLDSDNILSTNMSNAGCGTNPDGYPTNDCVILEDYMPGVDSAVLAVSSEWAEFLGTDFTDWMQIFSSTESVDVSIEDWGTANNISYGPAKSGTKTLATIGAAESASLRAADSEDSIYDTALIVVPMSCFEEAQEPLLCGNDVIDVGEECEDDEDCDGDEFCQGCLCVEEELPPEPQECDWWVRDHVTPITFTCEDQGDHPSGNEELCFKVSYDMAPYDLTADYCGEYSNDGAYMEGDWCCVSSTTDNPFDFIFVEDSLHDLEYFCRDAVNKTSEVHKQWYRVDSVPPTTTKEYLEPFYSEEGDAGLMEWIDTTTGIELSTEDGGDICHVDGTKTYYKYSLKSDKWCYEPDNYCESDEEGYKEELCDEWDCVAGEKDFQIKGRHGGAGGFRNAIIDIDVNEFAPVAEDFGNSWEDGIEKEFTVSYNPTDGKIVYTYGEESLEYYYDAGKAFDYISIMGRGDGSAGSSGAETILSELKLNGIPLQNDVIVADGSKNGVKVFIPDYNQLEEWTISGVAELIYGSAPQDEIPAFYITAMITHDNEWHEYDGEFSIPEESCHLIEFVSEDALGNPEEVNYQCAFVEDMPPDSHKQLIGDVVHEHVQIDSPSYDVAGEDGYFIWKDEGGWHIRWTTNWSQETWRNVKGTIYAESGEFYDVSEVSFDDNGGNPSDTMTIDPTGKKITFDAWVDNGEDGIDFKFDGNYVTFDLEYDGEKVVDKVYIGQNRVNPQIMPFTLPFTWINSKTNISLTCDDSWDGNADHPVGEDYIKYRVWYKEYAEEEWQQGSWNTYLEPFNLEEDSYHMIEFYCVDKLGHEEEHRFEVDMVDNKGPITNKTVSDPKTRWDGANAYYYDWIAPFCRESSDPNSCSAGENCIDCWKVTVLTPVHLDCVEPEPHPVGTEKYCFNMDVDAEDETERYCSEYGGELTEDTEGKKWCCLHSGKTFYFLEETEHNLEYYCVDELGNKGDVDEEKFKVEGITFDIELNKKWNLISVPFVMLDNSIDEAFQDIEEDIISVWTYDAAEGEWYVYTPGEGANTLTEMHPGWGYWVLTNNDTMLKIGGSLFQPAVTPPSKEVVHGWNLIGYYGIEGAPTNPSEGPLDAPYYEGPNLDSDGRPAYCTLYSLIDTTIGVPRWSSVVTYWEEDNPQQWKYLGVDEFMNPGAGYWVEMDVQDTYAFSTSCGLLDLVINPNYEGNNHAI